MTRSTARPAGINGKMRLDKEIRQLQQTSQMGSLPHRRQTPHKVRENPPLSVRASSRLATAGDTSFGYERGRGGAAGAAGFVGSATPDTHAGMRSTRHPP